MFGRRVFTGLACLFVSASASSGAVWVEFIDRGVPTDGVQTMHGWRGITLRARSDEGPIRRINLGMGNAGDNGVFGAIAQRWTDPRGLGAYGDDPSWRSPGPMTAQNLAPSEFNFDSHLLGAPRDFSTVEPMYEFEGQILSTFYTDRTGLMSTPYVGYGASMDRAITPDIDPYTLIFGGRIWGDLQYVPAVQSESIDFAYVVTDSTFGITFGIETPSIMTGVRGQYFVPEPATFLFLVGLAAPQRKRW